MTPSPTTLDALARFAESFPDEAAWMLAACIAEAEIDDPHALDALQSWLRFSRQYLAPSDAPGVVVTVKAGD